MRKTSFRWEVTTKRCVPPFLRRWRWDSDLKQKDSLPNGGKTEKRLNCSILAPRNVQKNDEARPFIGL